MTSKDTIDKLNRLEFFYYDKPPKTPEILEQDREQTERDFALIRKDLEVLEILKKHLTLSQVVGLGTEKYYDVLLIPCEDEDAEKIKEWLENEKL